MKGAAGDIHKHEARYENAGRRVGTEDGLKLWSEHERQPFV